MDLWGSVPELGPRGNEVRNLPVRQTNFRCTRSKAVGGEARPSAPLHRSASTDSCRCRRRCRAVSAPTKPIDFFGQQAGDQLLRPRQPAASEWKFKMRTANRWTVSVWKTAPRFLATRSNAPFSGNWERSEQVGRPARAAATWRSRTRICTRFSSSRNAGVALAARRLSILAGGALSHDIPRQAGRGRSPRPRPFANCTRWSTS